MTTATCRGFNKMSAEILTDIFKHALGNAVSADPTRLAISLVCKSWHRVLYENPSFWSKISIIFGVEPVTTPDWSFLEQALDLAHPHPIDIEIRFNKRIKHESSDEEHNSILNIITVLRMHIIHWRSLVLCLPEDLMYVVVGSRCLDSALSPGLQRVVLRGCHRFEDDHDSGMPITFSPQLRHLEVNFDLWNLAPHWGSLQNLCIGFHDPLKAREILGQAENLSTLVITHVGSMEHKTTVPSFVLNSVLDLSMSDCALVELHGILHCPHLITFRFLGIYEQKHVDHMNTIDPIQCTTDCFYLDPELTNHAISIIEASKDRISTLDASQRVIDPKAFPLLLRLIHDDLRALALQGGDFQNTNDQIFGSLMDIDIAPQLSSLEIERFRDVVVFCPLLEEIIVARHRAGVLRRVRMNRLFEVDAADYEANFGSLKFLDMCMQSSLAKTLLRLRREGLNAEWTVGKHDILELARKRIIARF
ncbi:hypothetical protein CYLTODRAFT_491793 [Cylindrobasidium torrendii FP15055 ss-10]|uniref:Uncharacterized protein n=1 Tax=Cylindrobasidium torrendii FP15055 ss-10 TaxID=1314674 RepID=A0A0D7B790_9AGAR|nr:hypothetical protein CYLTODRAFT_491793 [Cylindrobasidium torrendii FP15055 ss-10]